MASIRVSGFGGPGDPYVIQYNLKDQAVIQEVVDEVNARDPEGPQHIIDTYIQERITEMVASWMQGRVEVKSRAIKLAYETADDTTKDSVVAALGL